MTTLTLDGRCLVACLQAYEITAAGPLHIAPSLAGWIADPVGFVGGPDGRDAVLVGETATEVILAFRGTEPVDDDDRRQAFRDWVNDLDDLLVHVPGLPGLVHRGFAASLHDLWAQAWGAVKPMVEASPRKPICITGHSKGGGIAPLCAVRAVTSNLSPTVVTFAAPRCGDQAFADAHAKLVPASTRWEFADDVVPHLPPSNALGAVLDLAGREYAAAGQLKFIDWSGRVVADSPILQAQRTAHLLDLVAACRFGQIAADHDLSPGSGYANAICPGVWAKSAA